MPIIVPGVLNPITTDDLIAELGQALAPGSLDAAQAACEDAWAMTLGYLFGSEGQPLVDPPLVALQVVAIRKVAKRVAVRFFTNPQDRASYAGPEGLSFTMSPNVSARILTSDEKDALDRIFAPLGFA